MDLLFELQHSFSVLKTLLLGCIFLKNWLLMLIGMFLISMAFKLNKPLLVLITLEALTASVLVMFLLSGEGSYGVNTILMLTFFVSESLITLSSLYCSSRDWGNLSTPLLT